MTDHRLQAGNPDARFPAGGAAGTAVAAGSRQTDSATRSAGGRQPACLELRGVNAGYHGRGILTGIDLTVAPGAVTSVIGRNGSGKTTLLRVMAHQLPISAGHVLLDGGPIESLDSRALARRVAYLPQVRPAVPISVQTLVEHGRFPHLGFPRRLTPADREKVEAAMRMAGVETLRGQMLDTLSGGERQKAWIAMALAQDAEVILLDEPATWLDIGSQLAVYSLAGRLREQGRTVVMVVHDLAAALTWSDRIVLMADGRLVQHGTVEEVLASGEIDHVFQVRCAHWTDASGITHHAVTGSAVPV